MSEQRAHRMNEWIDGLIICLVRDRVIVYKYKECGLCQ
jgi:hypothetical protein